MKRSIIYCATILCIPSLGIVLSSCGSSRGDGICDPSGTHASAPEDCFCGNGTCDKDENEETCPKDCLIGPSSNYSGNSGNSGSGNSGSGGTINTNAVCGDGFCDVGESANNCPDDCHSVCGNCIIEPGETCELCGDGPNCDTLCLDDDPCTTTGFTWTDNGTGNYECTKICHPKEITQCYDQFCDGCCPPGCDWTNDTDCYLTTLGETCGGLPS